MNRTRFLLVEDDPDHAALICTAISQSGLHCEVEHAVSGEAALEILRHRTVRRPDVLLLDINLPGMDGLRVLEQIKSDHRLNAVPVVMLSTSSAENDIRAAHSRHANSYVVKPADFHEMKRVMQAIATYWIGVNASVS